MENLRKYLIEGLADWDEGDFEKSIKKETSKQAIQKTIRKWVRDNYLGAKVNSLVFNWTDDGIIVDYTRDELYIKHGATSLTNGLFKWGEIDGVFYCGNSRIKNFEGGPKKVNGTFNCDNCIDLVDMKGAPEYVGGSFYCCQCLNLQHITLPEYIKNGISFANIPSLKDDIKSMAKKVDYPVYYGGYRVN